MVTRHVASFTTYDLVLGIDGGGTNTTALLASAQACASGPTGGILGRGLSGPSNHQAVGKDRALESLDGAIAGAFRAAGIRRQRVGAVCFGLAGSDRQEDRAWLTNWAVERRIARHVRIENDGRLVLATGTLDGWGVAVIAGTGSLAIARGRDGRTARAGGWGYLLGDEGSAYAIAIAGLRAVARAADGRGPASAMTEQFLDRLDSEDAQSLIRILYGAGTDRRMIAGLAHIVTGVAALGDRVAQLILEEAGCELAQAADAAVRSAGLQTGQPIPLAMTGGVLLGCGLLRDTLTDELRQRNIAPEPVCLVSEPALGAVRLAREAIP